MKHRRGLEMTPVWIAVLTSVIILMLIFWWTQSSVQQPQYEVRAGQTLSVWIYSKPVAELLEEFQEQHPGISFDIRIFRSSELLRDELLSAISANMPPHLAEVDSMPEIGELAATGALLPVPPDLTESETAETTAAVVHGEDGGSDGDLDNSLQKLFMYDDSRWAVPYGASVPVLYYNMDLLRSAGVQPDELEGEGWRRLTEAAVKLTRDTDQDGKTDLWGIVADSQTPWYLFADLKTRGGALESPDELEARLHVWRDLVHLYAAMPALQQQLAVSSFINGDAGLLLASSNRRLLLEQYIGGTFDIGIVPFPAFRQGDTPSLRANGIAVLRPARELEEIAWKAAAYLLNDDVQDRMLSEFSQMPVSRSARETLREKAGSLPPRELALLEIFDRCGPTAVSKGMDRTSWKLALEIIERLEEDPDSSTQRLSDLFRP